MALTLHDRRIESVRLIDDDPTVRVGYRYSVEDLHLDPFEVFGPIADFESLVESFSPVDAIICDYNLKVRNYSSINGEEVVAGLYQRRFPALLCTRFEGHLPLPIRKHLKSIPVVLTPSELNADRLRAAFELCVNEFRGVFAPSRRPHRAVVRVEGGEFLGKSMVVANVSVPSWSSDQLITVEVDREWPAYQLVADSIRSGNVARVFAEVNLGADSADELFISCWSVE